MGYASNVRFAVAATLSETKYLSRFGGSVKKNALYAQSGGVTAVINASACGVIETSRKHKNKIGKVFAGRNGIIGVLTENIIDTSRESIRDIASLRYTPGGAFGSARHKLKGLDEIPNFLKDSEKKIA